MTLIYAVQPTAYSVISMPRKNLQAVQLLIVKLAALHARFSCGGMIN